MFKIKSHRWYTNILGALRLVALLGIAVILAVMVYIVASYYMGEDPRCGTTYTCVKVVP